MTAEQLAKKFHEAYEKLAPKFGYSSRFEGKSFDELPENNRKLMVAVCEELLSMIDTPPPR